jgi:hypothetical protein
MLFFSGPHQLQCLILSHWFLHCQRHDCLQINSPGAGARDAGSGRRSRGAAWPVRTHCLGCSLEELEVGVFGGCKRGGSFQRLQRRFRVGRRWRPLRSAGRPPSEEMEAAAEPDALTPPELATAGDGTRCGCP